MDFELQPIQCQFSVGLDAATRAISTAETAICEIKDLLRVVQEYTSGVLRETDLSTAQQNAALAALVREVANEHGWLEGWKCLAAACPDAWMHSTLIEDVSVGVKVYSSVRSAQLPRYTIPDIAFTVKSTPDPTSISQIGPKTIGSSTGASDPTFLHCVQDWHAPPDLPMGPCPFFAWIGVAKKVPHPDMTSEAAEYFWSSQLLGIVDYDFDKDEAKLPGGIKHAIDRTASMAVSPTMTGKMRGAGWIGLLTMDQQLFARSVQIGWVKEGKGSFLTGRVDISPKDFAIAGYVDCAALAPFAYQTATQLLPSRTAMFVAVIFANMHDLLFDIGCSSRITVAGYAASVLGVFENDLPQAFVVGFIDALAKRVLEGEEDQQPLYGDNALLVVCVWDIFNVRYRAWERFVKYTRLLSKSHSPIAAVILNRAGQGMVLIPNNDDADIGNAFESILDIRNISKLVPRKDGMETYPLSSPQTALQGQEINLPYLCDACNPTFKHIIALHDVLHAIPGLSPSVTGCLPVQLAAAIRQACMFATLPACCDSCACAVGMWANETSDKVVIALMKMEGVVSSRVWLLVNYAIGCVAFSPLRLISVTAGFDTSVDLGFERGAMGERDVVDA